MPKVDDFGNAPPQLVGGVAVVIAIIFFGTQAIFVKSKSIIRAKVDPLLVVCYFSAGVCLCGASLATCLQVSSAKSSFRCVFIARIVQLRAL
jgi:hypothetical protein